jgi:phosphoribosylformylglycinamidine cyclo-ligase
MHAHVDTSNWKQPRLMAFLQAQGNIEPEEMARTFNCGIGMVLAVSPDEAKAITSNLEAAGEKVHPIGDVRKGTKGCSVAGTRGIWSATHDWTATHNG